MAYCLYLRKSRADLEAEAHGEGETLVRHERILLELAKRERLDVTQIYREIVSGDSLSARPVMQQLLAEVEQGMWDGVLVAEVERLARGDTVDQGIVTQTFKYSGTKIITPMKTYDPSNEFDEEYFEFGLFMSRREYKVINRRLREGVRSSAKEGKWTCSRAPYGYERVRIENGKGWTLRPVEEDAKVVRLIFQLYVIGEMNPDGSVERLGLNAIARKLQALGIRTPREAMSWRTQAIADILENPVYIGKIRWDYTQGKKIRGSDGEVRIKRGPTDEDKRIFVDGLHPAIVDPDIFAQAQELRAAARRAPMSGQTTLQNPLAGILRCAKCGRTMLRNQKNGVSSLRCPNLSCDNVSCRLDTVEKKLLVGIGELLESYTVEISGSAPAEDELLLKQRRQTVKKAESELEKLRGQLMRTHDLLEQGVYDTETFLDRSRLLSRRIEEAEERLSALSEDLSKAEHAVASRKEIVPRVETLLDLYWDLPTAKAKNDMLREVLDHVDYLRTEKTDFRNKQNDNFELVIYPKIPLRK